MSKPKSESGEEANLVRVNKNDEMKCVACDATISSPKTLKRNKSDMSKPFPKRNLNQKIANLGQVT